MSQRGFAGQVSQNSCFPVATLTCGIGLLEPKKQARKPVSNRQSDRKHPTRGFSTEFSAVPAYYSYKDTRQVEDEAVGLSALCHQVTRRPSLGVDQRDQLPQLLPVPALTGVAGNPLLAFRRPWPGGLLPRSPASDDLGLPLPALQCPRCCHAAPPIVCLARFQNFPRATVCHYAMVYACRCC